MPPLNQAAAPSAGPSRGRLRVAVVFGGHSSEHGISCVSAGNVLAALNRERYDVIPVGIGQDGSWCLAPDEPELYRIVDGQVPSMPVGGTPVVLAPDPTIGGLRLADGTVIGVDVVFPVLHGAGGEDGSIQGVCELAQLPFVGSGMAASAVCMDKLRTKAAAIAAGIPVGPYVGITDRQWLERRAEVLAAVEQLGMPVFVKPARAGSSVGITKVHTAADLSAAIEEARTHDLRVIVEAGVVAREVECAVLATAEGLKVSPCAEIRVLGDHEFYDFEAKYLDGSAAITVPADIDEASAQRVRQVALDTFIAMGCEGMARVDVFLTGDGDVLLNEPNTIPGFTPTSMYPALWQAAGLHYAELLDTLIDDALRRAGHPEVSGR